MTSFKLLKDKPRLSSQELQEIFEYNEKLKSNFNNLPEHLSFKVAGRDIFGFKFSTKKMIVHSQDLLADKIINLVKQDYTIIEVIGKYNPETYSVFFVVWHFNGESKYRELSNL